jgi:Holliday junction DNA helicase RuvA
MIGKLKGKLSEIDKNIGYIETASGVFYKLYLPPKLLENTNLNKNIELYTYLQVREDNLTLFGFENKEQFNVFEMLLSVDGIGPKSAFNIISYTDSKKILKAVTDNNLDFFCSIPGIGKKTAQKILLELSSLLKKTYELKLTELSEEDKLVIDALVSLGFKRYDSAKIINKLEKKLTVEEKIKEAIRLMTQSLSLPRKRESI